MNKAGEAFGGKDKIQILGSETLQNGETQNKLIDLSCSDVSAFDRFMGQVITFPVGVIPSGKQVIFSCLVGLNRWRLMVASRRGF